MNQFCHAKQIPYEQRLTIYKSVIRSRLEYGAQIVFYDDVMIRKLDKLQLTALRHLLDIPSSTPDSVILLTTNILPIQHRLHQLQLNFYIKLRNTQDTLAHKVLTNILSQPLHLKRYSNISNPYDLSIKQILNQYGQSFRHELFNHHNKLPTELFRSLISCKLHQVATIELLQTMTTSNSTVSLVPLLSIISMTSTSYWNSPTNLTFLIQLTDFCMTRLFNLFIALKLTVVSCLMKSTSDETTYGVQFFGYTPNIMVLLNAVNVWKIRLISCYIGCLNVTNIPIIDYSFSNN